MILFIPISGYFVTILYGNKYFASIELMQWLLLETLFISQIQIYNSYAMSISKNYLILKLDILSLLLTVPLLYILVERYGALGVVWTSILVRAVVLLLFQKIVSKELGYGISKGLSTYGLTAVSIFVLLLIYNINKIQFVYVFLVLISYSWIYIKIIFNSDDLRIIQKIYSIFLSTVPQRLSRVTKRRE
jgi:O-antigen/teichoic acid export membrane protein